MSESEVVSHPISSRHKRLPQFAAGIRKEPYRHQLNNKSSEFKLQSPMGLTDNTVLFISEKLLQFLNCVQFYREKESLVLLNCLETTE